MGKRAVSKELIELGERIRNRRQEIHMSQETVAEKAGISVNTICRIEGGQTAMSIGIFMKLINVLEVDANDLLSGIVLNVDGTEQYYNMYCRIRHLNRHEQETVLRTVDVLVEGLRRCR